MSVRGTMPVIAAASAALAEAVALGRALAEKLLARGAAELITQERGARAVPAVEAP
ncbi:MAG: hypothetical protein JOZ89_07245 [Gammaproteobacteria bacterium]|nr:hypothetical protein [Gammaproteobacteria bacterium]